MKFLTGTLVAAAVSVTFATLAALHMGALTPVISSVSLVTGLAVGIGAAITTHSSPWRKVSAVGWLTVLAFALFALRSFLWLVFTTGDSVKVLSPNNLGDMSLHITHIRWFANGATFWPENPIFAWSQLHYPIGTDIFNAMLLICGVDLYRGLVVTGLAASLLILLACLRWGGPFTVAALIFNGGIAGFAILEFGIWADYQAAMPWKNFALSIIVTQRGMLYALPAGMLLIRTWRDRMENPQAPGIPLWVEWILYGTMPLFHVHTFIALSFFLGTFFVGGSSPTRRWVLKLGVLSLAPGILFMALVTENFSAKGGIDWQLGWMQEKQNPFVFWIQNLGISLPLALVAGGWLVWKLLRRKASSRDKIALLWMTAAGLLFVITILVKFQEWEWDNTKLMIWAVIAAAPFIWETCLEKLAPLVRSLVCGMLFTSGFVCLFGGLGGNGFEIASRSELDEVNAMLEPFAPDVRFAAVPTYNHPVLLVGRPLLLGYTGHLKSHGLKYEDQLITVQHLLAGAPGWRRAAAQLGVRYLYWGGQEANAFPLSDCPWERECLLVGECKTASVYDLQSFKPPQ